MTSARPEPFAPFTLRGGRVHLEEVALQEIADGLDGRAAWLVGHEAIEAALRGALRRARGHAGTVAVATVGPRAVLAQCAAAGCWARVQSSHELDLAREAGFEPSRTVAGGAPAEDGFLRDALADGLAVIECAGRAEAQNLSRLAAGLGHPVPPGRGAPPDLPATLLARCGGLLAPLLAGPPSMVLDAAWDRAGARAVEVLPLAPPARRAPRAVGLAGLGTARAQAARLHGPAARGEWVVVLAPGAAAVHRPDPAHPLPVVVMVRGAAWRLLDPRRFPPAA